MPNVNESNFDAVVTPEIRNEYRRRVKFALRTYFRKGEDIADRFRRSVDSASVPEQLLVYHQDPLTVAADLAGARDTVADHAVDYGKRFSDTLVP